MPNPTTEKSAPRSESRTAESHPTHEEVELRAYQIYVERGSSHGQDVEDWLQAEGELRQAAPKGKSGSRLNSWS